MRGSDYALRCAKCQREPLSAEVLTGEGPEHVKVEFRCPVGHVSALIVADQDTSRGVVLQLEVYETPQPGDFGHMAVGELYQLPEALRLIPDAEWEDRWR